MVAQGNTKTEITVIETVTHEDGTTTITKKRFNDLKELEAFSKDFKETDTRNYEIKIKTGSDKKVKINDTKFEIREKDSEEETILFFREAGSKEDQFMRGMNQVIIKTDSEYDFNFASDNHEGRKKVKYTRTGRTLLGVYVNEHESGNGLVLSGVVKEKGAAAAGLQKGDVVTAMNGATIKNTPDLRKELSKYKPGTVVAVTYKRGGATAQTNVELSGNTYTYFDYERDPCKVFIGVYTSTHGQSEGLEVKGVIDGTAAKKYGVQAGDIILALDGFEVNTHKELRDERDSHEPGEEFVLTVLRGEKVQNIEGQFFPCEEEEELEEEEEIEIVEYVEEEVLEKALEEVETEEIAEDARPVLEGPTSLQLDNYNAFPNPTYGKVRVRFNAEPVATQIRVFDATGKQLYNESLNRFDGYYDEELNLSRGTAGTLFINIRQGDKVVTKLITLLPRA